jgi:peptidoglycan hydrolase CwlO-like protein
MDSELAQMHKVLKQMQERYAKSKAKDSVAKADLDMWGLMVGHLDKELQQLRVAMAQREDMEARRAALYKQADAKAEAEAQAFRAAQAAKFAQSAGESPTSAPAGPGGGQSTSGQSVSPQPSPAPPTNSSPSPN